MRFSKYAISHDILCMLIEDPPEGKKQPDPIKIDLFNSKKFVDTIADVLNNRPEGDLVLVDISNVTYMDSAGLWSLLEVYKTGKLCNVAIGFINMNPSIQRILDITKMNSKIPIFKTNDEAIASLQKNKET